jgi:anti-sigma28 factor (negative regulator of flagellin synthesis)
MDPFDNPRDPAEPANKTEVREAQESGKPPSDSEPPIDDARREKIEKLKKAVADGTYSVTAEELANKLIEHMLEPKE